MIGNKFKGLGKGLSALMGDIPQDKAQTKNSSEKVPIHFVYANPSQPRKNFNQELLNELLQVELLSTFFPQQLSHIYLLTFF